PTLYRTMAPLVGHYDLTALRTCISSGEHLPASVWEMWRAATGLRIQNSIGSTEMLHAFVAMPPEEAAPGPCGRPLPGHAARIVDEAMNDVPPGAVGRLAIRGPTGCRYLDDEARQRACVRDGW